jgi:hypothetical protein
MNAVMSDPMNRASKPFLVVYQTPDNAYRVFPTYAVDEATAAAYFKGFATHAWYQPLTVQPGEVGRERAIDIAKENVRLANR